MHYRTKCCEPKIKLAKAEDFNPGRLVEKYLNEIFDERKISEEQRAELWKFYFDHLDKGIAEGYSPKVEFGDEELVNSLRQNIAEFCAFKENSFRNSATDLLIDENGNLRGKSEFLAEAAKINDEYNRRWLGTEYDQTVANANSAQQWQDFQRAKDLYPNLRYMTVGDDRVRAEHEALDGIVKPLDDPFWDAWMPPNDWGCRCWVEQTDDEPNGEVPGGVQMKIDFDNNPGKTGEIFPKSAYEKGLSKIDVSDSNKFAEEQLSKMQAYSEGKLSIGNRADPQDLERNKEVAEICIKTGHDFHIRDHSEIVGVKNPEYLVDGKYLADRKSVEGLNNMRKVIDDAKKQMLDPSVNPKANPYSIVWDFDKVRHLDIEEIERTLCRKITEERGKHIEGMFFQYKGRAVYLSRETILSRNFGELRKLK